MRTKSAFRIPWICLLLLSRAGAAQGFDASSVQRLGMDKDYLLPSAPARAALAPTPVTAHSVDESQVVVYQSFQGQTLTLTEFSGKSVSLLLPQTWVTGLTVAERRTLLDRIDLQYEHMKNLLGWEPGGDGLLRIAMVPETCGWGCGYIGAKGVEVLDADWSLGIAKSALSLGEVSSVFTHEMTHNFDVFWEYLTYTDAHAWTALMDVYALVNSQQGNLNASPSDYLFASLWERWNFYARNPEATWENAVRDGDPAEGLPHVIWGGMHLRYAQLYGPAAVSRAMGFLRDYAVTHPAPIAPEEKEDLDVEALAAGAGLNLACQVDLWHWHASAVLRSRMTSQYGNVNPVCATSQSTSDTGGGVVRESADFPGYPVASSITLPVQIQGSYSSTDNDYFHFGLARAGQVLFRVGKVDHDLSLAFYDANNSTMLSSFSTLGMANRTNTVVSIDYPRSGDWNFAVTSAGIWSPGTQDNYLVAPSLQEVWPAVWGSVRPAQPIAGGYHFQLDGPLQLNIPFAQVRFWVSGVGFVGSVPYAPSVAFDWPATLPSGTYSYRAQLFVDNVPVSVDTGAVYFSTATDSTPPVITPQVSGPTGRAPWYRGPVSVAWTVTDPESAISSTTGCGTIAITTETQGIVVNCSATNAAGLSNSASVTIRIDSTPPVISGMPAAGACVLSPPDHRMVKVASVTFSGAVSGLLTYNVTGSSNEPPSNPPASDIDIFSSGAFSLDVQLRADQTGGQNPRVYTLNATATDVAGNVTNITTECTVPIGSGAVGQWAFNEGSGTLAADSSGNGNAAALARGATWSAGHTGSAVKINNGIVNVGSPAALTNLTRFTWAFWALATGDMVHGIGPAIEKGNGSDVRKTIYFGPNGTSAPFQIIARVAAATSAASSTVVGTYALNVWAHWTMTYDDLGDRRIHIYRNGVEVAYISQTPATGALRTDADTPMSFGATPNSGWGVFNGSLDDIKIYNRVLSGAEIAALAGGTSNSPALAITKTHAGNFKQGQSGAAYSVIVRNSGAGSTSGAVTVSETLPSGLTLASMTGTGWTCAAATCNRSDALSAGASYPPISVLVNVAANATSPQLNGVHVSGGGSAPASATDSTVIDTITVGLPDMTIDIAHTGNFTQGQAGATFILTASNVGNAPSAGTVTVSSTITIGAAPAAIAGLGWTCAQPLGPCTRADALAPGASYPPITLSVNVAATAGVVDANASVSGGGESSTLNNTKSDHANVLPKAGAVGRWTFSEGAGTSAADSSGIGNTATLASGAVWTAGHYGSAVNIHDGVVKVGSPAVLNNLTRFTWSFWAKPTGDMLHGLGPAIEKGIGSDRRKTISFGPNGTSAPGQVTAGVSAGNFAQSTTLTGAYALNVWAHWAITYDDLGDRKVHIYRNGVEVVYSVQVAATGLLRPDADTPLAFGATPNSGWGVFNGALDEVEIYNRVLTPAEIAALAAQ